MKGDKKGGREESGGRGREKVREARRKSEDDVTPNFTYLEALQLWIWDAVVAWCFASCK